MQYATEPKKYLYECILVAIDYEDLLDDAIRGLYNNQYF